MTHIVCFVIQYTVQTVQSVFLTRYYVFGFFTVIFPMMYSLIDGSDVFILVKN